MLVCVRCAERKAPDQFSPDPKKSTGRDAICKVCRATAAKLRRSGVPSLVIAPTPVKPDAPASFLGTAEMVISERAETSDPVEPAAALLLRAIGREIDALVFGDNPPAWLQLQAAWLRAAREAGLTNGPRKPKAAAEDAPKLRDVAGY